MPIVVITGSNGLIGAEASLFFHDKGFKIIGIDNDMRAYFFGSQSSNSKNKEKLTQKLKNYEHNNIDIRDFDAVKQIFSKHKEEIKLIIHTAAQPSHDWAAKEPFTDFSVNANGTLNMLEATRQFCPEAVFIFTSTNKVYGDTPNSLPLIEKETRWEIDPTHPFAEFGIDESMSIDQSKHSLFGASKVAADVLVQEYGRYFDMKTVVFRGGCLTGPAHSPSELHGFLAYLILCAVQNKPYTIFGYKGKQVRDNIHSKDLIQAFWYFYQNPKIATVYNMGGGRHSNISILEAIQLIEKMGGHKINYTLSEKERSGDHIWYVSDTRKFQKDYPQWKYEYTIEMIVEEMLSAAKK
jgi:CDP-paratose 2-epimerase